MCLVCGADSRAGGNEMKHPVALQFRKEEEGEHLAEQGWGPFQIHPLVTPSLAPG